MASKVEAGFVDVTVRFMPTNAPLVRLTALALDVLASAAA